MSNDKSRDEDWGLNEWRDLSEKAFNNLEDALERSPEKGKSPETAGSAVDDLWRRYFRAVRAARAALTRARARRRSARGADVDSAMRETEGALRLAEKLRLEERRSKGRRERAVRLAKLFARVLSENGKLRDALARGAPAGARPDGASEPEALEQELKESRETVVNLMVRLSHERRRARAELLVVRRRLKSLRPSVSKATGRLKALEDEFAESQKATAELLIELTRRARRAEAERKRRTRARGASAVPETDDLFEAGGPLTTAAVRMSESLRVLVESPAVDPELVTSVAGENIRLARALRLIAALVQTPQPRTEPGSLLHDRIDAQLDLWEPEIQRRRLTLLRMYASNLPQASVGLGGFEAILDELVGVSVEEASRGTSVMLKIAAAKNGGLALEFSDKSRPAVEIPSLQFILAKGGSLPGFGLALARELVERWGGALEVSPGADGHGRRLLLLLAPAKSPKIA
jgi:hypothetical protein